MTVDTEGLRVLLELLEHPKSTKVSLMPAADRPVTRSVSTLSLELSADDAVTVATDGEVATIAGSPAGFARLAREVRQFRDYNDLFEPGMHAHFDAGPGDALAEGSDSLIVSGPIPDDTAPEA